MDENGASLSIEKNQLYINHKDDTVSKIPVETIDSITITGNVGITSSVIRGCLSKGITISFLSKGGSYFGYLESSMHVNAKRQRMQAELYKTDFAVALAKKIMRAKIQNQLVVLRRYDRTKKDETVNIDKQKQMMKICFNKIETCSGISEIIGYEGQAAKYYFSGLAQLIKPEFRFQGRNRRPPRDPFNSMLSFGYSVLMSEIYQNVRAKGLNPYFGFVHQDRENHPTLVSDLMEEWRPTIVDATVMSMLNGNEVQLSEFMIDEDGCYIGKECMKKLVKKINQKLDNKTKYLSNVDYEVDVRYALSLQINSLIHAMEERNADSYIPFEIR